MSVTNTELPQDIRCGKVGGWGGELGEGEHTFLQMHTLGARKHNELSRERERDRDRDREGEGERQTDRDRDTE